MNFDHNQQHQRAHNRDAPGKADAGGPEWDVTGAWPKVTLSPSIGFAKDGATGQFHWHGYLEDGMFVER